MKYALGIPESMIVDDSYFRRDSNDAVLIFSFVKSRAYKTFLAKLLFAFSFSIE